MLQEEDKEKSAAASKDPEFAEPMEDVPVELNFIDPTEAYFQAVRYYLINLLDGESFNVGDLADAIITQVKVGTLVVNEGETPEDKNVLAFASILPLAIHGKRESLKSICKYCVSKASDALSAEEAASFRKIVETKKLGVLINERYCTFRYIGG